MSNFPMDRNKIVKNGSKRSYGPDIEYRNGTSWRTKYYTKSWEVGKSRSVARPYNLAYRSGSMELGQYSVPDCVSVCDTHIQTLSASSEAQDTRNKRYARLVQKLYAGDSASMGAFFGELGSSVKMIAERAQQLASGLRSLKRGDVAQAMRTWAPKPRYRKIQGITVGGIYRQEIWAEFPPYSPRPRKPNPGKRRKTFSENLLELDYGWTPLVKDIFDFAAVVNGGVCPPFDVKASASRTFRVNAYSANSYQQDTRIYKVDFRASCGGSVTVSNPWLHLAAKMGVVNPVAIAWEVMPFTFFSDQFFNIGQMLNAPTELLGLDFTNYYETESWVFDGTYQRWAITAKKMTTAKYRSVYITRTPKVTPSLPKAVWRGNPYAENPRDPDSLKNIVRKAVDHLAVCATLLSSAR